VNNLKQFLDKKIEQYNHIDFIENDPISIPHLFTLQQDIEIAAFFSAILAWGNRKSIINSCKKLMACMNNEPYHFILNLDKLGKWKNNFKGFTHRTFNSIDAVHLIEVLHYHFAIKKEASLETAFTQWMNKKDENIEAALNGFYNYCFNETAFKNYPTRTQKHIASPNKNSACKRLNMFLRWMVRQDKTGVDFGLWKNIKAHQLIMPLDVHVMNVSQHYQLIQSNKANWKTAVELTNYLKQFDAKDPIKYDFALFSLGVVEKTSFTH
jgi:uncharacterized protein (TIGR02757 family)